MSTEIGGPNENWQRLFDLHMARLRQKCTDLLVRQAGAPITGGTFSFIGNALEREIKVIEREEGIGEALFSTGITARWARAHGIGVSFHVPDTSEQWANGFTVDSLRASGPGGVIVFDLVPRLAEWRTPRDLRGRPQDAGPYRTPATETPQSKKTPALLESLLDRERFATLDEQRQHACSFTRQGEDTNAAIVHALLYIGDCIRAHG